jgi:mRNA interferase MazF
MNSSRAGLVIVVPVTRTRRGLFSHVELNPEVTGLADVSYAKVEDIKSVSRGRLVHRLGHTPAPELRRMTEIVRLLLDM